MLRVAQEAVRNTLRHAGASVLDVSVHSDGELLVLDVVDDGVGFDPDAAARRRTTSVCGAWTSLVARPRRDARVDSAPGEGTTVRLEVPSLT